MIDPPPEPDVDDEPSSTAQTTDQPRQDDPEQARTDEADATTDTDDPVVLSRDNVFDALKNSRRRQLIRYLDERDERVALGTLAEHVAALENDTEPALLDSDQRKRVYVGLYQSHLPRLDAMDVVDFDQSRGHVELGATAPQVTRYLYFDEAGDGPVYRYPLAVAGVAAVMVMAGVATGMTGSQTAATLFVGFVLGAFGISLIHAVQTQR